MREPACLVNPRIWAGDVEILTFGSEYPTFRMFFLITNNLNRMIGITHIFEYPYFLNNSYKMFDIMDKMLSFFMTE